MSATKENNMKTEKVKSYKFKHLKQFICFDLLMCNRYSTKGGGVGEGEVGRRGG